MLSVWEKDFSTFIDKHIDFLNENLEDQDNYSLKFSEILENMDIFNQIMKKIIRMKMKKIMIKIINLRIMMKINQMLKKMKINKMR